MGLRKLWRIPLWTGKDPAKRANEQNAITLNVSLPSKRHPLPVTVSLRLGRFTWNTRRGFQSIRLGNGYTWQDTD